MVTERKRPEWSNRQLNAFRKQVEAILLQEWGGPRSPIALRYVKDTVIPDLLYCFQTNADLLANPSFEEIVAWKLKTQFAYPRAAATDLAHDLLQPGLQLVKQSMIDDPKEPWRRIFRLWVGGESLPNIAEKTGYPLDYLDLLLLRLKKVKKYLDETKASLWECLQHPDLRQMGMEQLNFFYQFITALTTEPLYKERLGLEQAVFDLGLPLQVVDLLSLFETIYFHDGKLAENDLLTLLGEPGGLPADAGPAGQVISGLMALHYAQRNKSGGFSLSEKGIRILSGYLLPKLSSQLETALKMTDWDQAEQILLAQNPEVLVDLLTWAANNVDSVQAFRLSYAVFKKVNRRVDIYVLEVCRKFPEALEFLLSCLNERDSLLRAKAAESLGFLGNKEASFGLVQLLRDSVTGVRERAAFALGELGASAAAKELTRVAEDYAEATVVRERAQEALRMIKR